VRSKAVQLTIIVKILTTHRGQSIIAQLQHR